MDFFLTYQRDNKIFRHTVNGDLGALRQHSSSQQQLPDLTSVEHNYENYEIGDGADAYRIEQLP